MANILVKQPTKAELDALNIDKWSEWSCDISEFDWHYDQEEICYLFEGEVIVTTDIETVEINGGDLVTFPKGLDCKWKVEKAVKKVYKFND